MRNPYPGDENWAARAELFRHLRSDYELAFDGKLGTHEVQMYRLADRLPSTGPDVSMNDMGATRRQ